MKRQQNWSNILLRTIYLALLAVLLPHTAWAFGRFESPEKGWLDVSWGMVAAWAAAIAALAHKLAKHIETTLRFTAGRVWLRRRSHQYLNAYAAGLLVAVGVSVLANFGHAVEFGRDFATPAQGRYCVFGRYNVPPPALFAGIRRYLAACFAHVCSHLG